MTYKFSKFATPGLYAGGKKVVPFDPSALSNPVAWYRAEDAVDGGSGKAASIPDKYLVQSDLVQGTAGNRPAITAAGLNGKPVLTFDQSGSAQFLSSTLAALPAAPFSMMGVFNFTESSASDYEYACTIGAANGTPGAGLGIEKWYGGAVGHPEFRNMFMAYIGDLSQSVNVVATNAALVGNTWHTFGIVCSTSAPYISLYLDGVLQTPADDLPGPLSINDATLGLGKVPTGGGTGIIGKFAEVVMNAKAYSASDVSKLQSYFNTRYGI